MQTVGEMWSCQWLLIVLIVFVTTLNAEKLEWESRLWESELWESDQPVPPAEFKRLLIASIQNELGSKNIESRLELERRLGSPVESNPVEGHPIEGHPVEGHPTESLNSHNQTCHAEVPIFGSLGHIELVPGTVSFILILAAIIVTEFVTDTMEEATADTAFHKMALNIEKELMTIGFMSFMFKILLAKQEFEESWKLGLEFAGCPNFYPCRA